MSRWPRAKSVPGIIFAILTILLALGNFDVGLYPYGTAVWLRPLFSLIGIIGAIMLLAGNGWWRALLTVWCALQTAVIATDVSGPWFAQGLFAGFTQSESVRSNQVLISFHESGVNFAGLILLAILWVIIAAKLHPEIRRPVTAGQRKTVGASTAVFLFVATASVINQRMTSASTAIVLNLDIPGTPIYYQDQLLGRTPLYISPKKVLQWGLPLSTTGTLSADGGGWCDALMLSDGTKQLPLYAGPRWPFESDLDTFQSPWGTRCRMNVNTDPGTQQQHGYLLPRARLRDEPILMIDLINSLPVPAGGPFKIHCLLTNPAGRGYDGKRASIERHCLSYIQRSDIAKPFPDNFRREVGLPQGWNSLPPGAKDETVLEFDAPLTPDTYELFCTWDLFSDSNSNSLVAGSVYSNMITLQVAPLAATQP